MHKFRAALTAALVIAGLVAGTAAALASPGQVTSKVNIRSGPGGQYDVIGVIREGQMVDVSQCSGGYCYVSAQGGTGWISASFIAQPGQPAPADPGLNLGIQIGPDGKPNINFGINQPQPQPQPQPQLPRPPRPDPIPVPQPDPEDDQVAQACFYSSTNFNGSSFCVEDGDTVQSLGRNWNDRIRSVEVLNGATVDICADRNLVGTCQTLTRSKTRLAPQLDRNISSVEVY